MKTGILHGDLNEKNVLTNQADDQVYAVLDWGDVHVGPRILDLAVMLAYVLIAPSPDGCPLKNVGLALATYLEHVPAERHSLLTLKVEVELFCFKFCYFWVVGLSTKVGTACCLPGPSLPSNQKRRCQQWRELTPTGTEVVRGPICETGKDTANNGQHQHN